MRQFELTVTRQSRVVIAILVFAFSLPASLYLGNEVDNVALKIILPLLLFIGVNTLSIYSSYCNLTVTSNEGILKFRWKDKFIFDFEHIDDIRLEDINTLVIEKDPNGSLGFLYKIVTNDRVVRLGLGKFWRKDANSFILHLHLYSKARVIDNWDVIKEKGFLGVAYWITTAILIAGAGLYIWILADNGLGKIEFRVKLMFISSYFAMISYWLVIKKKMKKTGGNNRIKQGL